MDTNLKQKLIESRAGGMAGVFEINTLSFWYDGLKDTDGNDTEIYMYNANMYTNRNDNGIKILTATLENGVQVDFLNVPFEMTEPDITTNPIPELKITIDNVGMLATDFAEQANDNNKAIRVTHRLYLSDDLTAPATNKPTIFWLGSVQDTDFNMSAVCSFPLFANRQFPKLSYTTAKFPGLSK